MQGSLCSGECLSTHNAREVFKLVLNKFSISIAETQVSKILAVY